MILDQNIVIFKIPHYYVSKKQLFWPKKTGSINCDRRKKYYYAVKKNKQVLLLLFLCGAEKNVAGCGRGETRKS